MPSPRLPTTVEVSIDLLRTHIEELDRWNDAMAKITGKPANYYWASLEELRAHLPENRPCPSPPKAR